MKHYTLILTSILMLLCGRVSAQYDDVSVKLEVARLIPVPIYKLDITMSLAFCIDCKDDKGYSIYVTVHDYTNGYDVVNSKSLVDTVVRITKQDYDKVMSYALAISSRDFIENRDEKGDLENYEGEEFSTKISISTHHYSVSYWVYELEQKADIKHLNNYLYVYKELERLTGGDFDNALLFGFQDIAIKK